MARVNLTRRAEIGREKRERTRAAILAAARALYGAADAAPVTVEAITTAAGLAKGTFYFHFTEPAALEAELAAELLTALDERLQPARLRQEAPLARLATAFTILAMDLAASPELARLVVRAAAAMPAMAPGIRARLAADLAAAQARGELAIHDAGIAADLVSVMGLMTARGLGEGRIESAGIPAITAAMLRALGMDAAAAEALARDSAARAASRA